MSELLQVQEPWFSEVAAGRKTVEGRTGPEGKYAYLIGGTVTLVAPGGQSLQREVAAVRHYPTLEAYLSGVGWERAAPQASSFAEARELYLGVTMGPSVAVFAPARVRERGGINAIELGS